MTKNDLLKKIRSYDFAMYELQLYLDTHPNCQKALTLFEDYKKLYTAAQDEYAEKYGKLGDTVMNLDTKSHWSWIDGLWPWERS